MAKTIPAGWQEKTLGEVCDIEIGKTPSRSNMKYWDKQKSTTNIWLSIADLNNDTNKNVYDSNEYLSDIGANVVKLVKKGTLLLSFKLTLGRVAFAGKDLRTNEAIAQLPIKNDINKFYLYYYLKFFDYELLLKGDVKVKGKTLNKAKLKLLPVYYPSLPEQERIVAKLDKAFEAIDKAKAIAENNLKNAKELFRIALNKEVENCYKCYHIEKLSSVCDVRDGTHDSPKYVTSGGHPFITSKNLKNDTIDMDKITYISDIDYNKVNERSKVDIGDVLFAMIGTIGNPVVITEEPNFAIKNVALFKSINKLEPKYLQLILKSSYILSKMQEESKGATQRFVSLTYLRNFLIPVPQMGIQRKFVLDIQNLHEQTKQLEAVYSQKIKNFDELKQSILKRAFRGEL